MVGEPVYARSTLSTRTNIRRPYVCLQAAIPTFCEEVHLLTIVRFCWGEKTVYTTVIVNTSTFVNFEGAKSTFIWR